jgi:hypothetical protein
MTEFDTLRDRAEALHLHGLVSHWPEVATEPWGSRRCSSGRKRSAPAAVCNVG